MVESISTQQEQKAEGSHAKFLDFKHIKEQHFKCHSPQKSEKLLFNHVSHSRLPFSLCFSVLWKMMRVKVMFSAIFISKRSHLSFMQVLENGDETGHEKP